MKITVLALCFLCAAAAFGQTASVLYPNTQPVVMPSHPEHASQHDMGTESSLLGSSAYSYGRGEQPLWEFASDKREVPLGDVARAYRKGHVFDKKAVIISTN
ncbi:MAG: hypothetical protein WBM24_02120 [Candidatus Sulfotelmatobacter sp.]